MTKTKKYTLDFTRETDFSADQSGTCCGVLEVGNIELRIPRAVYESPNDYLDNRERRATDSEILAGFKDSETENSKTFGLGICYLLSNQRQGWFGKCIRASGWAEGEKFWNPKTRNTLWVYTKVYRKGAPKMTKKVKAKRRFMP